MADANPDDGTIGPTKETEDGVQEVELNLSGPGAILGRYVFSEHGDSPSQLQEFFPLNSSVLQMPVVGEVVLGFNDKATQQRYYFGRLNTTIDKVNFQNFNLSSVGEDTSDEGEIKALNSGRNVSEYKQGNYFFRYISRKRNS